MYKQLEILEERLYTVLPPAIKKLIDCRSAYYAEIAYGWQEEDLQKAAQAYIQAMQVVILETNNKDFECEELKNG